MGSCISKPKDKPVMLPTPQEIDNWSTLSRREELPPPLPDRGSMQYGGRHNDQSVASSPNPSHISHISRTLPKTKSHLLASVNGSRPISALDLNTAVAVSDLKPKCNKTVHPVFPSGEDLSDYLEPIEDLSSPPKRHPSITDRQQSKASLSDEKRDQILSDYVRNVPQNTITKYSKSEVKEVESPGSPLPGGPGYVNAGMLRKVYHEQRSPKNKTQFDTALPKEPRPLPRSSDSESHLLGTTHLHSSAPTTPNMSSRKAEGNGTLKKPVPIPRDRRGTEPNIRVDPSVTEYAREIAREIGPISPTPRAPRVFPHSQIPVDRTTSNNSSVSYSSSGERRHISSSGDNSRSSSSSQASPAVGPHNGHLDLAQRIPRSSESESRQGFTSGYLPMNEQQNDPSQLSVPKNQPRKGSLNDLMVMAEAQSISLNMIVKPSGPTVGTSGKEIGYLKILPGRDETSPPLHANDYYNVRPPAPNSEPFGYININQPIGSGQSDSGVEDGEDAYS